MVLQGLESPARASRLVLEEAPVYTNSCQLCRRQKHQTTIFWPLAEEKRVAEEGPKRVAASEVQPSKKMGAGGGLHCYRLLYPHRRSDERNGCTTHQHIHDGATHGLLD